MGYYNADPGQARFFTSNNLTLPADLPAGRYKLWAGIYEYETIRNLEVRSAGVPVTDNRLLLGEIEVGCP